MTMYWRIYMHMIRGNALPKDLYAFHDNIQATRVPALHISSSFQSTDVYCSKFIGNPYLPKSSHYPTDKNGEPMKLLAQINFSEVPNFSLFPSQGIVQFFVPYTNPFASFNSFEDVWQRDFKVRFFKNPLPIEKLVTDFSQLERFDNDSFPIQKESRLLFTPTTEPVSALDYRFNNIFQTPLNLLFNEEGQSLYDIYMEHFLGSGHKMGGYPYFITQDPRHEYPFLKKYDVLLLQIDSDEENGIMWGNCGVANFFINRDNLLRGDFSDILYHWDHY